MDSSERLEQLEKQRKSLLRQWHAAEEAHQWQEADRSLRQAEAIQDELDSLNMSPSTESPQQP